MDEKVQKLILLLVHLFMRKKILYFLSTSLLIFIAAIYFCNKKIEDAAAGKMYTAVQYIPYNKVALLLGTGKYLADDKTPNPFFYYRILATVELYKAGKIKYIIASGDNSTPDYNEPVMMR